MVETRDFEIEEISLRSQNQNNLQNINNPNYLFIKEREEAPAVNKDLDEEIIEINSLDEGKIV